MLRPGQVSLPGPDAAPVLSSGLGPSSGLGMDPCSELGSLPNPSPKPGPGSESTLTPNPVKSSDAKPGHDANPDLVASPGHGSGHSSDPDPVPSPSPNPESRPDPIPPTHNSSALPTCENPERVQEQGALLGPDG